MNWEALRDHVVQSIAAAALLGGGTMLLSNSVEVGKQETRIERLERLDEKLDDIQKDVATTREAVARLETKMEDRDE